MSTVFPAKAPQSGRRTASRGRFALPLALIALLLFPETRSLATTVLADAFWQVACYVAATLWVYGWLREHIATNRRVEQQLERSPRRQVVFAAGLGALPGCGGAIIVVTQFVRGQLGFGSMVAVLVATMGDAAFLLISTRPAAAAVVVVAGFVAAVVTGWLINVTHPSNFLRPPPLARGEDCISRARRRKLGRRSGQARFWRAVVAPGSAIAVLLSLQVDIDALLPEDTLAIVGATAAVASLVLWSLAGPNAHRHCCDRGSFEAVAEDTNFVTCWVVTTFLAFEFIVRATGLDLGALLTQWRPLLPLGCVVVGLLPGCGPQIVVTSLFVGDALPLSGQPGNALSNDGDALFPALALAPKAAALATAYSTIPALLVAYGWFWLME